MIQFGPGFTATFLYYFVTTAVIVTFVSAKALNLGVGTGLPQQTGLLAGLIAGLLGAYFNRTVTQSIAIQNKKTFLKELNTTLSQLGYEQSAQDGDVLVYERPNLAKFLAGKVYVQLDGNQATIATRAAQLKQIRSHL